MSLNDVTGYVWRHRLPAAVLIVAVLGLIGLGDALTWWIAALIGFIALLAAFPKTLPEFFGILAGAFLLSLLALVGANVLAHLLHFPKLPIEVGLLIATAIFTPVAYWYLRNRDWSQRKSALCAGGLAFAFIFAAPIVYGLATEKKKPVPHSEDVASKLDVFIVTNGRTLPRPQELPADPALGEFDISYSVGFSSGDRVRWTLSGGTDANEAMVAAARGSRRPAEPAVPTLRAGTDPVLLLLVDGSPPVSADPATIPTTGGRPGDVAHWSRVARSARSEVGEMPTFALLRTRSEKRVRAWRGFVGAGKGVSVQDLGSQTLADAGFRLALAAPTSRKDLSLATLYQPILLFDKEEPVPRPLSIAALFAAGDVRLCHDRRALGTDCDEEPLLRPRELESGGTHLGLTTPAPRTLQRLAREDVATITRAPLPSARAVATGTVPRETPAAGTPLLDSREETDRPPPGAGSAIYVHPVSVKRDGRRLLYLDYWWYLTDNPVGVGDGALCGFGLVIAGVTCQNHQSDWEGITVVVDRTGAIPRIQAVQYAQHDSVVYYDWDLLVKHWRDDEVLQKMLTGVPNPFGRPIAFVSNGTHSTYPDRCGGCKQFANKKFGEGEHRGGTPWVGNYTATCGSLSCLQMLPTREFGRQPALWSAYDGPWGDRHCFFVYYCDSGSPPSAPGQQGRYGNPAHYDGYADAKFHFQPGRAEE